MEKYWVTIKDLFSFVECKKVIPLEDKIKRLDIITGVWEDTLAAEWGARVRGLSYKIVEKSNSRYHLDMRCFRVVD